MKTKLSSANPNLARGYTIAIISAVILATTAIFIRHLTQTYQIPPLVLAFWRDTFVALTLLPALGLLRADLLEVKRQHLFYLIVYGLMLAIFNALWTTAVALTGAAVATVLVYSSAGFTAILGRLFLQERLDWAKLLVVVLTFSGCVLVSDALDLKAWSGNALGILTGAISGLMYAIYSLLGRSASQRGLNPWTTLFYTFGFAALFLLMFNFAPAGVLPGTATRFADFFWLGNAFAGWGILFMLAAGPTLLGYGLYNVSLSHLPSSIANLIVTSEPVFTAVIAYALLGERLTMIQIIGGLMILGGVIFLRVYEGRLAKKSQPELYQVVN